MAFLNAGVAVRDVTPGPGVPLWGYSDRTGPATGTLDPLFAKAIVLRAGDDTAAIVSLDVGRPPLLESRDRIRARAKAAGVDNVLLIATHTHHGPVMEYTDLPHTHAIEAAIGDAIVEAASRCEPVRIGVGETEFDIAHNRRHNTKDGRCVMVWRNEERRHRRPVDREATIIKIDRLDGSPLACIVHYACHPVIMGPSNLEYSADYPGEMARLVNQATGGECVFLQGGCGDINPYLDKTPISEGAVNAMRAAGAECAKAVLSVLDRIPTGAPANASVAYSEQMVEVGTRWDLNDDAARDAFIAAHGGVKDLVKRYAACMKSDLSVPVSVLVVNNSIAIAGFPGEVFVRHQLALKHLAPVHTALLCGYTNDYHLYLPPVRDAVYGGYGGTVGSYVGLGAADKLLLKAQLEMVRLIGADRRVCTLDDFVILDGRTNENPLSSR